MKRVTVLDYGSGNIFSIKRALEHHGAEVEVTSDGAALLAAERVIMPGVGAFKSGMDGLNERGLIRPLQRFAETGRPLLGVCLGMQLLFESSLEFGEHEGLGMVPGCVLPIKEFAADGSKLKVPHIGWSPLSGTEAGRRWDGTIFAGLKENCDAYFVHSLAVVPQNNAHRLADTQYGGQRICAAIQVGNLSGCQFHPERSGPNGLKIIENFLAAA